jgi:serine/threonine protein kinase
MEGALWEDISDEAKDLISKILVVNPQERLTIE